MCKGPASPTAGLERGGPTRQPPRCDFTDAEQNFARLQRVSRVSGDRNRCTTPTSPRTSKLDDVTPDRLFNMAAGVFRLGARARQAAPRPTPGIMSSEQTEDIAATDKTAAANAAAAKLVAVPGVAVDFEHKHHPVFAAVAVKRERK